jgi:hypothetical protein
MVVLVQRLWVQVLGIQQGLEWVEVEEPGEE